MFKPGNQVRVLRDIYRREESSPYAVKGEIGEVIEVFHSSPDGHPPSRPNAKVLIDGQIKTFRLTSLEKFN